MQKVGLGILIFAAALLLRLAMVGIWHTSGRGGHLSSDATEYYNIAQSLISGHGFRVEATSPYADSTFRRGPVYPLTLALSLRLTPFPLGIQLGQAIFGAASCAVLFWLGQQVFGVRTGALAAGIQSLDYLSLRQTVSVMPEIVFVFLVLLSTWFFIRAKKECRTDFLALAGFLAGLAILTKEVLAPYFLLASFWLLGGQESLGRKVFSIALFLFSLTLTVVPWLARNYFIYRQGLFLTASSGHSFFLGNNPQATVRLTGEEWDYYFDSWFPQDDPAMPPLFTPEADRYLFKRGLDYVKSHPRRFLESTAKKILRFWFPYYQESPSLVKGLTLLCYLPVLLLGGIGLLLSVRRWKELVPLWGPIFYLMSVYAVTISSIRYRYPAMPFLTLFAALAAFELPTLLRRSQC